MRSDGIPFGITLLAPGGHDALLSSIGRAFHADTGLPLGALGLAVVEGSSKSLFEQVRAVERAVVPLDA